METLYLVVLELKGETGMTPLKLFKDKDKAEKYIDSHDYGISPLVGGYNIRPITLTE